MKTIKDLFELILNEELLNNEKYVMYKFAIDTHFNWVSMWRVTEPIVEAEEPKCEEIFVHESIEKPYQLQLVYWMIYNHGRSRHLEPKKEGV